MIFSIIIVITVLWALYQNSTMKYYMKYIIFSCIILVGALYYSVEFAIRGTRYKNGWRFKKCYKLAGRMIGLNPIVKGLENLDPGKPCVFVANHQSLIDVASISDVWPENCTIIVKESVRYWGPIGLISRLCKVIYIDRSKHKEAVSIMQHACDTISRDKVSIFIFPEGTRSSKDKLIPFKKGAFYAAVQCQYPIQPVVIAPYTRFLDHEKKRFECATYGVQVLPQISTTGKDDSHVPELLRETFEKMSECLESLRPSVIIE